MTHTDTSAAPVVLFDFDGVLYRGDSFTALLRTHLRRQWWRVILALPLLLLVAPFAAVRRTRRRALRFVVHLALLGVSETHYREMADAFGRGLANDAEKFIAGGLQAIKRHAESGARVVIVSGCEETLVRAILDELGLRHIEVIASRLVGGRFGMRVGVHTFGPEKVRQLAAHGIHPPWDVAYSDSSTDAAMLVAARSSVLVNAKPATRGRLVKQLGRDPDREVSWE
jgi:phosphatidylglycerophosphatase C